MNWLKNSNFVKGIGVGFILSGLLFTLNKPAPLSNQDIINRASELGMVYKDQVKVPAEQAPLAKPDIKAVTKPEPKIEPKLAPASVKPAVKEIVIPKGANSSDIANMLKSQGFINDVGLFQRQVDEQKAARRFQAGTYQVPTNASVNEIIKVLTKSKS